jgi:hypothetical protein
VKRERAEQQNEELQTPRYEREEKNGTALTEAILLELLQAIEVRCHSGGARPERRKTGRPSATMVRPGDDHRYE